MRLELKKNKLGWFIKGSILANIILLVFLGLITGIEEIEGDLLFKTEEDFFMISSALVRGVYIVFAAVLISKIIIDEFKNKTILVLFSYPINRKKILGAKLMIIFCITFFAMLFSNIIVNAGFIWLNQIFHLTTELQFTQKGIFTELVNIFVFTLATAGAALIPLYFGLRKYSTPATIISSLLIAMVVGQVQADSDISLANIIYIPLGLAIISLGIIVITIKNIDRIDIE